MGRRGHNEGSIHQRESDGRWVGCINLGYKDGKRNRKYFYGQTRREVAEKMKVGLRDQQRGLPVKVERKTVSQFLDRWLEDSVRPRVRPSTLISYSMHVNRYMKPAFGNLQLAQLSPQDIQTLQNGMLKSGLSPRSVQYMRSVLRSALNQAVKWDLVVRNVATLTESPRSRRPEVQPLSTEQVRVFLEVIRGDRLEALYVVAVALGLRQGEALALQWDAIDLNAGVLNVRHTLQKIAGHWEFLEPKTDRSRRAINMPLLAVTALRTHRIRQLEEQLATGERWQDWNPVFPSAVGTPLDGPNVTHHLQKLLKKAGLPRQRFHDLRHCCASLLLVQAVSPRVVMEILGHSQISLTRIPTVTSCPRYSTMPLLGWTRFCYPMKPRLVSNRLSRFVWLSTWLSNDKMTLRAVAGWQSSLANLREF